MTTAAELKKAAELLEAAWLERRDAVKRAETREAKAKAAYFNAHEAYVVAQQKEKGTT